MVGVLEGVRVVELGIALVGPWAAKQLGSMGAEVVKLEMPEGEMLHMVPPYINGTSAVYISANINKRCVTVNLKDPEDRERALSLIDAADVFIENLRPGTAERLGLSYEILSQRNPQLVAVSASAYGTTGPMAQFAGADGFVQAFSGWCSLTGRADSDGEMLRYPAHMDITAATVITEAVLLALVARARIGRGQHIEIDMLNASLSLQTASLAEFLATGEEPVPRGSASATTAPHQAFLCSDGKYLAVGVVKEDQWLPFCEAMRLQELARDERFTSNDLRLENYEQLVAILNAQFASKPSLWWAPRLVASGVPNGRVLSTPEVVDHPQVSANQFIRPMDTPHWGPIAVDAPPWIFHGTPSPPQFPGGLKGEHTDEVLGLTGQATASLGEE